MRREPFYAPDELYAPMRRDPDDYRHEARQRRLVDFRTTPTPCFARAGDIQRFPGYSVRYRGRKRWCELHLRRDGVADPRSMFRVHPQRDDEERVVIVGLMPSHLDENTIN